MDMSNEVILCVANAYNRKFYINEQFNGLPEMIKEELQIMCVLYTEDVGGVLELVFDEDGMIINQIFCTLNFFQVLIFQSSIDFILNESWRIHLFLAPELRSFPGRTGYLLCLSRLALQGIPGEKIK